MPAHNFLNPNLLQAAYNPPKIGHVNVFPDVEFQERQEQAQETKEILAQNYRATHRAKRVKNSMAQNKAYGDADVLSDGHPKWGDSYIRKLLNNFTGQEPDAANKRFTSQTPQDEYGGYDAFGEAHQKYYADQHAYILEEKRINESYSDPHLAEYDEDISYQQALAAEAKRRELDKKLELKMAIDTPLPDDDDDTPKRYIPPPYEELSEEGKRRADHIADIQSYFKKGPRGRKYEQHHQEVLSEINEAAGMFGNDTNERSRVLDKKLKKDIKYRYKEIRRIRQENGTLTSDGIADLKQQEKYDLDALSQFV